MSLPSFLKGILLALFCFPLLVAADPALMVSAENPSGIAAPGQKIVWHVAVTDDPQHTVQSGTYVLKKGNAQVIGQGTLNFEAGPVTIAATLNEPGTVLAEISVLMDGKKTLQALAGAAFAPDQLTPSSPAPDDFDSFWAAKIAELNAVPEHPVLEKKESGKEGVDYWKITLDNIRGSHIYGQLARPTTGHKLPAMLVVQWAGVYALKKKFATDPAHDGWLVLNINAHDFPIDNAQEFYNALGQNELKAYASIGNDDREQSYFLRMFLACYRAAEYLSNRPDWDGRTLVVTGASQGGWQALATAALHPKITAVLILVPAGCDNTGALAGRNPGWPGWTRHAEGKDPAKVLETARYFDGVNFAARIHCPTLVGMGLLDSTSPPSGVFSACNQLRGAKELVVMPDADHRPFNNSHSPYYQRTAAWLSALSKGQPAPVEKPGTLGQ
jgi:cephalosporin-C deacetylase-like acetyl esterase